MENERLSADATVIHVAIAFDTNYLRPFYALMQSILDNTSSGRIHFHVIATGVGEDVRRRITGYVSDHGCEISYYSIDAEQLSGFVLSSHWTVAVYYRFFFPWVVPASVRRLLYLDTDTLVLRDLSELYHHDLGGYPVGAAYDTYVKKQPLIGITAEGTYFNSGVLLIDVAAWREQKISERAMDYLAQYPDRIRFVDQCALNAVLRGNWYLLPGGFNLMYSSIPQDMGGAAFQHLAHSTTVVHFTLQRPWNMLCQNRFRSLYFRYLHKSLLTGKAGRRYDDFDWRKIPSWLRIRLYETYQNYTAIHKVWRLLKNISTR